MNEKYVIDSCFWDTTKGKIFEAYRQDKPNHKLVIKTTYIPENDLHCFSKNDEAKSALRIRKSRNKEVLVLEHLKKIKNVIQIVDITHPEDVIGRIGDVEKMDRDFIIFEKYQTNLHYFVKSHPTYFIEDVRRVREFSKSFLQCLRDIHDCNIIHGDISTMNILWNGIDDWVLADFGSSLGINQCCETWATKSVFACIWFRSPEKLLLEEFNEKIDVYSFGVVLLFVCTCQYYFRCEKDPVLYENKNCESYQRYISSLVSKRQNIESFIDSSMDPKQHEQLIDFLKKMLKVDPNERMNVQQCLDHPFITNSSPSPSPTPTTLTSSSSSSSSSSSTSSKNKRKRKAEQHDLREADLHKKRKIDPFLKRKNWKLCSCS